MRQKKTTEQKVQDKLYEMIAAGGGDDRTITEYARVITRLVRADERVGR